MTHEPISGLIAVAWACWASPRDWDADSWDLCAYGVALDEFPGAPLPQRGGFGVRCPVVDGVEGRYGLEGGYTGIGAMCSWFPNLSSLEVTRIFGAPSDDDHPRRRGDAAAAAYLRVTGRQVPAMESDEGRALVAAWGGAA